MVHLTHEISCTARSSSINRGLEKPKWTSSMYRSSHGLNLQRDTRQEEHVSHTAHSVESGNHAGPRNQIPDHALAAVSTPAGSHSCCASTAGDARGCVGRMIM